MKGSAPLLGAVILIWLMVWLFTQTLPTTALATAPTVAIGVAATLAAVWGYPSVIRGPRRRAGLSAVSVSDVTGDPLTQVSRSLPHLRDGLTEETAARTANVLLPLTGGRMVEITDRDRVLGASQANGRNGAIAGAGQRSATAVNIGGASSVGRNIGAASRAAIERVEQTIKGSSQGQVVATPLKLGSDVLGSLVVTYDRSDELPLERLHALGELVSLYLEISELGQHDQRVADAELEALRAQINPHFLFNTLNTIASKNRTNPDEARQLLQRLSDFFRYSTQQQGQFAEFAHEYFFVRTYLSLEQARFSDRLTVHYDIDPQVLPAQVPVLTIQPLVENAVKHGIAPKPKGGTVSLKARVDPLAGSIRISVRDDGIGMDSDYLTAAVKGTTERTGVGLRNIHQRLDHLYGDRYSIEIHSSPNRGTRIDLELPL